MDDLQQLWKAQAKQHGLERSKLLDHFENEVSEQWNKFTERKHNIDKLKSNQKGTLSKIACFEAMSRFFGEGREVGELGMGGGKGISTMVGVIDPAS
jgi:hypothetical protein